MDLCCRQLRQLIFCAIVHTVHSQPSLLTFVIHKKHDQHLYDTSDEIYDVIDNNVTSHVTRSASMLRYGTITFKVDGFHVYFHNIETENRFASDLVSDVAYSCLCAVP